MVFLLNTVTGSCIIVLKSNKYFMYIKSLKEFKDKEATLKGWIYNLRSSF